MNLLKRLFSIGSKKNKKRAKIVHNVPLPERDLSGLQANDDQEHEAAVGRLLRSSSARYVETPELDYATLPPLPHPINKVIQTPASSTVSLASTSLSQRGTYNVTVHKRRRHASTEFPQANRDLDDQQKTPNQPHVSLLPVEDSRVLRLRSDPSVASLLDLYDEHGKLSSNAFSNSPPNSPVKEGRAQCRRNGSTLRQLLGAPSLSSRHENDSGSEEGDISWAEKFLAETESASSASSIHTPNTPPGERERDISFSTDGDLSGNAPENPAISSMEVELSMTTDISQDLENLKNYPYMNSNPSTPQRASQVFGFLTRGKQSKPVEEIERSLPQLPSAFSSPSDENVPRDKFESHLSDSSLDFPFAATRFSAVSIPLSDDTPRMSRVRSGQFSHPSFSLDKPASQELRSTFSDDSHDHHVPHVPAILVPNAENPSDDDPVLSKQNDIKVIMNGPTKVIVTAPTPSTNREASSGVPRGPRSFPRRSSSSVKRRRSALVELGNSTSSSTVDPFTAVPSRRRTQTHHRTSSQNSTVSISRKNWDGPTDYISKPTKLISTAPKQKENQLSLTVRQEIPATPLRSNTTGSHSLFRSVVHQGMFRSPVGVTPSPASSSEMSPVGRQMMMDVRQQRLKAREAEREKSGKRFGAGRNGVRI